MHDSKAQTSNLKLKTYTVGCVLIENFIDNKLFYPQTKKMLCFKRKDSLIN